MLNEFVLHSKKTFFVTASAFSQARKKLKHTAFIELNENIVSMYYKEQQFKKLYGFRILAVDGSQLTLPHNNQIKNEFGSKPIGNHTGKNLGEYCRATFETCYDVLNNIAIKSVLSRGNAYEVNLVNEMLPAINADDLLIFDRGYASYDFIANLSKRKINYIIRCSRKSFIPAQQMFEIENASDMVVKLKAPAGHLKNLRKLGLPTETKVRLIKVKLSSDEVEVLVTSLINDKYKVVDFKKLYFMRWGVETYFSKLKGRLCLENFTGKSVEAVKQDFWATIFISNLETMITEDIELHLNIDSANGFKKSINKAVSFNAIKNLAFEILIKETDKDLVIDKLTNLFMMKTHVIRKNRESPRYRISDTQSLNYQKRVKKQVF